MIFLHWNILFLCILLYSVKRRSSFIPDDYSVYQYHLLNSCSFSWWFITYYFLYLSGSVSEHSRGFSGGTSGKEPADQCRRHKRRWFDPWIGKIHWRRSWQPTPVYLPRASSWTEEPGGLQSRVAQGQTLLKQLSMHACRTLSSVPFICIFIYGLVPQCFNYWGFIMCSHIWAFITHRWTYFSSFQNFPGYPTPVSNINLNIILST